MGIPCCNRILDPEGLDQNTNGGMVGYEPTSCKREPGKVGCLFNCIGREECAKEGRRHLGWRCLEIRTLLHLLVQQGKTVYLMRAAVFFRCPGCSGIRTVVVCRSRWGCFGFMMVGMCITGRLRSGLLVVLFIIAHVDAKGTGKARQRIHQEYRQQQESFYLNPEFHHGKGKFPVRYIVIKFPTAVIFKRAGRFFYGLVRSTVSSLGGIAPQLLLYRKTCG